MVRRVVLAYSGGLDTSVAAVWLREQIGADVVTLTVDVGGGSLREGSADRAISAGPFSCQMGRSASDQTNEAL